MAKIEKHAEYLDKLKTMMMKTANPTATGVPGKDTHFVSVSDATDHVDKNSQGKPEKNPQDFHQKPSGDSSEPAKAKHAGEETDKTAAAAAIVDTGKPEEAKPAPNTAKQKAAEDTSTEANPGLAKLAEDLAKLIAEMQKEGKEKPIATGVPGKDTNFVSVSDATDHVNKNEQGKPEKNPQDFNQKPSKDPSEPAKAKKAEEVAAEEAEKIASYRLGQEFAREFLKVAAAQNPQVKTAGRRDFEQLIAQAAAELEENRAEKQGAALFDEMYMQEKQAEEAGAAAFNEILKVAQYEYALQLAAQNEQAYKQKLAALQAEKEAALNEKIAAEKRALEKEAALNEKLASEKRAAEMQSWSEYTVNAVVERLKHAAADNR